MCGFIGKYVMAGIQTPIPESSLEKILLGRRGPEEFFIFSDKNCEVRFHRRHTWASKKPLDSLVFPTSISYAFLNGTIHNYKELDCTSDTDHEALAWKFSQDNLETFKHLIGSFAAVIKEKNGTLTLATDFFGEKEIYWATQEGNFWFGSSPLLIACHLKKKPKQIEGLLKHMCMRGLEPGESYFYDIHTIPQGLSLTINGEKIEKKPWPRMPDLKLNITSGDISKDLPIILKEKCGGEGVGLCLSGGVDSSSILVTHLDSYDKTNVTPVVTLSDKINESAIQDSFYSKKLLQIYKNKVEHFEVDWFEGAVPEIRDQPVLDQDEYGLAALYSTLSKKGCRAVLSGDGADELFCGYDKIINNFNDYDKSYVSNELFVRHFVDRYSYSDITKLQEIFSKSEYTVDFDHMHQYVYESVKRYNVIGSIFVQKFFLSHHLYWLLRKMDFVSGQFSMESRAPYLNTKIKTLIDRIRFEELAPYIRNEIRP